MCILCAVQRGSRRAIGMLPWLVVPLVLVWGVSQLLPSGLRLEITSPRLACVAVLLVTIFWYEILLPHVSAYRKRRCARVREQQLSIAVEVQKLRKTATRRCRNCLAPYRDQNPGGGKFMCSSCGHPSKRPILDLPDHPGTSNSGFLGYLIGNRFASSSSSHWGQERVPEEEPCLRGGPAFSSQLLSPFSLVEDSSPDAGIRESPKESKGVKAKRKAEERRLARVEREMLEEEERKQREEVARLVEERRKLREDDKESDVKEGLKASRSRVREEEPEKGKRDRKKEKDKEDHDHKKQDSSCNGVAGTADRFKPLHSTKVASFSSPRSSISCRSNRLVSDRVDKTQRGKDCATGKPSSVPRLVSSPSSDFLPFTLSLPAFSHEKPVHQAAIDPPPKLSWHQLFALPSKDQNGEPEGTRPDSASGRSPSQNSPSQGQFCQSPPKLLIQDLCFEQDPCPGSLAKDDCIPCSPTSTRKTCDRADAKKPSPIESPSKPRDRSSSLEGNSDISNEHGTWKMWSSSLCEGGLDLEGGPASWLSALETKTEATTLPPAEMEKNILGSTHERHHPWADRKRQFYPIGFHGGPAQNVEWCLRPYVCASHLPPARSQGYYYSWGWPIPWRRNVGIPMVIRPPQVRSFFGCPPRASQEQMGTFERW